MFATITPDSRGTTATDLGRQIVVISAFIFMIIGCFVGVGALGGPPIQDAQGGSFRADASYLTPSTQAFSIWSVIYLGLFAYTIWQALPGQRASVRHREMGWLIAASMVCNGVWLVTVQFFPIWATLVAIVLLLAVLCATFVRSVATRLPRGGVLDSALIDGTTGLHLGWTTLATVANLAALLTAYGPSSWATGADAAGVTVVIVVLVIALVLAWWSGWRVTPGLAIGWGLAWLAVGRLANEPHSAPIGVTAAIAAVLVIAVPTLVAGVRSLRPSGD